METIWLQRSSPDIPWGFRMVGGREFGLPLTIQRVTPGSVAAAGLGPGDIILKVGNVMATNLEHNDAQELVRQAANILQLTIKKVEGPSPAGPVSPGSGYGSQVTAQLNDNYHAAPKGFGTAIPINVSINTSNSNTTPNYATTPRNYGSQYQPPVQGTRIEIQRVNPTQPKTGYGNRSFDEDNDGGGPSFPDYTIPYKQQGPIHDSPGGPVNIRGYVPPSDNNNYNSKSLPRSVGGYSSNDRDAFGGSDGPPAYEPRSYNTSQSSFATSNTLDNKFSTGTPCQTTPQKSQIYSNAPQSFHSTSAPQASSSVPGPFSSPSFSSPLNLQTSSTSGFVTSDKKPLNFNMETSSPSASFYNQAPSGYGSNVGVGGSFDQSSIHGSGSNTYSTLPHSKPSYSTNNNSSYNVYTCTPQPYSTPKSLASVQPSSTYNASPLPFTPSQSKLYQSPMSPGTSSGFSSTIYPISSQPAIRRVSFDQNICDNGPYSPSTNFSPRPYKSPPPPTVPSYNQSASQYNDYEASDFGTPVLQPATFSRQSSRPNEASVYVPPGGPMSPSSETGGYDVNAGLDNLDLSSPRYEPPLPPPPPPPAPAPPPPPPAPPLNEWNATPFRRQHSRQQSEEKDEQKVPDVLLKSAKSGGPKPFSYGIDLSELKKKIGPPTAPKPRKDQPDLEDYNDVPEVPRLYGGGPPRKPAGQIQSDYFIKRDDNPDYTSRPPKKPTGQIQGDYFLCRDDEPRAQVDESPININMGTNPKKQSKSFKVLQWMTETEQDDPQGKKRTSGEPSQKPKRSKDPERRHNAEDDEMRFSGLHSKADIPSKAFSRLQKMPTENSTVTQNGKDLLEVGDAEDGIGNYDDTSIRYKGRSIPSPSFRILQTWAEHDPDPNINTTGTKKEDEEDDGLPDILSSEEMVDKRYKGGNIPSKVFKTLQKSVGDDTPETLLEPLTRNSSNDGGQAPLNVTAPISDF